MKDRKQVGHLKIDIATGAAHKEAIVTLIERKSGFVVLVKVDKKKGDLTGRAISAKLKPID